MNGLDEESIKKRIELEKKELITLNPLNKDHIEEFKRKQQLISNLNIILLGKGDQKVKGETIIESLIYLLKFGADEKTFTSISR